MNAISTNDLFAFVFVVHGCYVDMPPKITDADDDDEEDDDPECLAQTMMEIDYDTVVDDEDVVDEFCVFKDTLHGEKSVGLCVSLPPLDLFLINCW